MSISLVYIMHKNATSFNTLAAKANPQQTFEKTEELQNFNSVGFRYLQAYKLRGLVDGSLEHFPREITDALDDEHPMFLEYLCERGCDRKDHLEAYCVEYATNSHNRCETLLLELLS